MTARLETLAIIFLIAVRNLFASRLKTVIVGGIIFFGALLVVTGSSLVDSVDRSMRRSITGSLAGDIQVYSSESKDELSLFGTMGGGDQNLEPLPDFARLRETLLAVPNIKAVVPMGLGVSVATSGNTVDVALEKLRGAVRRWQAGERTPAVAAEIASEKSHVRQIVSVLQGDQKNLRAIADARSINAEEAEALARASSDAFWNGFDADPLASLEFLENRVAPQASDADMLFIRYLGTDPDAFARSFERMRIVEGTNIPRGQRGFLFGKFVYEDQIKLKNARRLDKIKLARDQKRQLIARDPELQRLVRENTSQVRDIVLQLDAARTAEFRRKLQTELGSHEQDVSRLLAQFFDTNDASFDRRFRFFYDQLAPSLQLYRVKVGDTLTIKSFTRGGYVQSANVKVYGTFEFTGLESSDLAGATNLMDLVTFRDLYGFISEERQREIEALKKSVGAKIIERSSAEAELFGSTPEAEPETAAPAGIAEVPTTLGRVEMSKESFDPAELERGFVMNAAVILHDPARARQTIADINQAGRKAGMPLKAVTWQAASGLVGQFVTLMRLVLYISILIIFLVALVIINNALVMATLERVQEFGTLRAIGAQRRFILSMLLLESMSIGLLFGGLGMGAGFAVVKVIGHVGIPAWSDIVSFLFSGPRLHPTAGTGNFVVAVIIVLVVSIFSSLYPGWLAMRVNPRQAMQDED